ncbi:calcium/calmodulin-dependent protein kinase type II delta chain-like [Corticium candelabrum]|uniref:calcium/calmodulin-dependent protein kinase type II delta chain-like n=1 Tax=Corticium candelabrum TaxID=121492 RepID=UPI002E257971|nr:calcium/calmodulin-dependent protein kinase type II delta chain-like [Corticium candelabrum]
MPAFMMSCLLQGAILTTVAAKRLNSFTSLVGPGLLTGKGSDQEQKPAGIKESELSAIEESSAEMQQDQRAEIVEFTEKLLEAITTGDYETYKEMVVMDVSCFENETCGELVSGMELHQFLFDHVKRPEKIRNYILHPKVVMLGDQGAMIAYVRLMQFIDK